MCMIGDLTAVCGSTGLTPGVYSKSSFHVMWVFIQGSMVLSYTRALSLLPHVHPWGASGLHRNDRNRNGSTESTAKLQRSHAYLISFNNEFKVGHMASTKLHNLSHE